MGQGKNWTKEDVEYLENAWGRTSYKQICSKLHRTKAAVTLKASRLGLGRYIDGDGIMTYGQLATALGLDNSWKWHKQRLIANGLPVYEKLVKTKCILKIKLEDFWKWAETHKDIINWSKLEKNLLGQEPKWVDERRKIDYYNYSDYNTKWSEAEDSNLRHYIAKGMTYEEIAAKLDRTGDAIRSRCYALYLQYPKRVPPKPWSQEEISLLLELKSKGYKARAIALQLKRSEHSVRGKLGDIQEKRRKAVQGL